MSTLTSLRDSVETTGRRRAADVPTALVVCAECRFAQLYAVQPRAVCTCPGAAFRGSIVFSGQPACDDAQARGSDDLTLASCSQGTQTPLARFSQPRPHLY